MTAVASAEELICAVYVDMGTTNTRAWLMRGSHIVARASQCTGTRDSARVGSSSPVRQALTEIIHAVRTQAGDAREPCVPAYVAAAGMISSPLGLMELAHIAAPAGVTELA